mgnify:CR=1 FL=1|jgi:catechol 2,3-dioxygenase-like lactoylglutathione lyase family enzyme
MRLDHIAYRVSDREAAVKYFNIFLGYIIDPAIPIGFDIQFEDNTFAKCYVLKPPESQSTTTGRIAYGYLGAEWHAPPEIFVSDGSENSIVADWVAKNGPGIHHLAYEVDSVEETMKEWNKMGLEFTTNKPLKCPGLVQAFTLPNSVTGIIYEVIERTTQGFCRDNVKDLMKSTVKD